MVIDMGPAPLPAVAEPPLGELFIEPILEQDEDFVACPFCAEPVRQLAKRCKHCGETLDIALRAAEEAQRTAERARRTAERSGRRRSSDVSINQTVVVQRNRCPHALHLILTLLTCGLWLPIWIIHAIVSD